MPEAVHSCARDPDWPKLACRLVAKAQDLVQRPICIEPCAPTKSATIQDTLLRIEQMIVSGKAPCVFFRGISRHYSVISGYTPLSLLLFDSFGYCRVLRRSCETTETATLAHRYQLRGVFGVFCA